MHPLLLRRLRPVAAVILVFFSWFSIEPWNFALAAQSSPTPRTGHSSASQQKPQTAPEVFETSLRAIKEQVGSARDGEAYQAQLAGLLKSLDHAVAQSGRELEASRQAVDQLARAIEQGAPSQDPINILQTQQQTVKAAVGQVRLNTSGIEGLLRGMAFPAGLTQSENRAKEAVTALVKAFDAALTAMTRRAEQQRAFDSQEHQAFLAASMGLDQGLAAFHARVQALAREATPERRRAQLWEEAFSKRDSLLSADREIRKEFAQTELFLKEKGLPQEILDRHEAAVSEYEKNFNQLKGYLAQLDKAHRAYASASERGNETAAQAAERDLESRLTAFDDFLKANVKDPPHQPLDPNNLPHRTPKPQERKPRLKKEQFTEFQPQVRLAYNGDPANLILAQATADLPKPEDLAETIEVRFTPEIHGIVDLMGHDPVQLYEFVRNNFAYEPYHGSVKGSQAALLVQAGNDFDQASVLIALLRASATPARYAYGTIEIPIAKAMDWLGGVTKPEVVGQILATNGIPSRLIFSGSMPIAVQIEHAWVEAYLPYTNYRGKLNDSSGSKTWIPLDPSFKVHEPNPQATDLATARQFDIDSFFLGYLQIIRPSTPAKDYLTDSINYVAANLPGQRFYDLLASGPIGVKVLDILPNTLPYPVRVAGARSSQVPDTLRHRITFELTAPPSQETVLVYTAPWATLLHGRLTISYEPATAVDEQTITSFGGLYTTPPYLVLVRPVWKLEGVTVGIGSAVNMAGDLTLRMSFVGPEGIVEDIVTNQIIAGADFVVGLDAGSTTGRVVTSRTTKLEAAVTIGQSGDPVLGEFLNLLAASYLQELDSSRKMIAKTMRMLDTNHVAELMVGVDLKVSSIFGVPRSVGMGGVVIDVDRNIGFPIDMAGDLGKTRRFQILDGMTASALEHTVFEAVIGAEAISAIKALEIASIQGIPIHTVDNNNLEGELAVLELSAEVEADIRNAVHAGKMVTVSERNVQVNSWTGVGYILLDPITGSGAYMISGGLAGGSLTHVTSELQGLIESKRMTQDQAEQFIKEHKNLFWFPAPVDGPVSSKFGSRYNPETGQLSQHKGIDFAVITFTPVIAIAAGTVTKADFNDSFGNVVEIDHGAGVTSRYAHNCELRVSQGQHLQGGEVIAGSGNTGRVRSGKLLLPLEYPHCSNDLSFQRGAHVHFEIAIGGEQIDPDEFIIWYY